MGHSKQENCDTCHKLSPSTNCKEILRQITISIGDLQDAPKSINIKVVGEPLHPELSRASGQYVLQDRLINKLPYWQHSKFAFVIWHNNVDNCWMISHSKDIGTSKWIFVGPIGSLKWPHEISFKGKVLVEDNSYTTVDL